MTAINYMNSFKNNNLWKIPSPTKMQAPSMKISFRGSQEDGGVDKECEEFLKKTYRACIDDDEALKYYKILKATLEEASEAGIDENYALRQVLGIIKINNDIKALKGKSPEEVNKSIKSILDSEKAGYKTFNLTFTTDDVFALYVFDTIWNNTYPEDIKGSNEIIGMLVDTFSGKPYFYSSDSPFINKGLSFILEKHPLLKKGMYPLLIEGINKNDAESANKVYGKLADHVYELPYFDYVFQNIVDSNTKSANLVLKKLAGRIGTYLGLDHDERSNDVKAKLYLAIFDKIYTDDPESANNVCAEVANSIRYFSDESRQFEVFEKILEKINLSHPESAIKALDSLGDQMMYYLPHKDNHNEKKYEAFHKILEKIDGASPEIINSVCKKFAGGYELKRLPEGDKHKAFDGMLKMLDASHPETAIPAFKAMAKGIATLPDNRCDAFKNVFEKRKLLKDEDVNIFLEGMTDAVKNVGVVDWYGNVKEGSDTDKRDQARTFRDIIREIKEEYQESSNNTLVSLSSAIEYLDEVYQYKASRAILSKMNPMASNAKEAYSIVRSNLSDDLVMEILMGLSHHKNQNNKSSSQKAQQ